MSIRPHAATNCDDIFDVSIVADSDWASCTITRKSTTGCTITVRGMPVQHYYRTQSSVALSARENELLGMSSGWTETIGMLQILHECNIKTSGYATGCTDSTAGMSMAPGLSVSRATKQIQRRVLYIQGLYATGVVRLR